jgi:hypothetical protein
MIDQGLTELRRQNPSWHIRRPANASYVIATRGDRSHLTDEELEAGLYMTLIEDTLGRLGEVLASQVEIERALCIH